MIIETKKLAEWNKLRDHGDATQISQLNGLTLHQIVRAFQNAECSESVYTAIAKFYEEKKIRLQKLTA